MQRPLPIVLHPAMLPPGTLVGSWRLVALVGCGTHGAVYRALTVDDEQAPAVALKLALHPSPELGLLAWPWCRGRSERHRAGPADDLYALGVTACRLATGEYPMLPEPQSGWRALWRPNKVIAPLTLSHVEPGLRELILRMLSVRPEERGTAVQLTEALDQAAARASPQQLAPLLPEPPVETRRPAELAASREWSAPRKGAERWFVAAACVLVWVAWVGWLASAGSAEPQAAARAETRAGQKDAGTTALGEAAATLSQKESPVPPNEELIAEESLPEPLPGQIEPDAKGRCPYKRQIALNGGCWVPQLEKGEACEAMSGQMYKGTCYVPIIDRPRGHPRPPTSGPTKRSTRQ